MTTKIPWAKRKNKKGQGQKVPCTLANFASVFKSTWICEKRDMVMKKTPVY